MDEFNNINNSEESGQSPAHQNDQKPVEDKPAEEIPAEKKPVEEQPAPENKQEKDDTPSYQGNGSSEEPRMNQTPPRPQNDFSYGYSWNNGSSPSPKKSGNGIKVLAVVMTVIAFFAVAAMGLLLVRDHYEDNDNSVFSSANGESSEKNDNTQTAPTNKAPDITVPKGDTNANELTRQQIIAAAKPGVVGISATVTGGTSVGSGFIYAKEGYIITNYHVVSGAQSIKVTYSDGTEADATLIGGDSLSDVAVIKVETANLTALTIGDSDSIVEGDEVIAIGTPAGLDFAGTCTHGMISAVNREISIPDSTGKVTKTFTVIQTDAAINTGNSGGPLLNSKGQVIGVNSLKLANGYEGMGFALPINGVTDIANQLISNGSVTNRPDNSYASGTPAIGITVLTVSEQEATSYGWPQGAYVYSVVVGGAAEEADIKRGDIITAIDGENVISKEDLVTAVSQKKIGDKVTLKIYRDSEYIDVEVTLKESNS